MTSANEIQSFSPSNNMLIRVDDQLTAVVGFAVCPSKDQASETLTQPCVISDGKIVPFTSSDEFELVAVTPEQWVAVDDRKTRPSKTAHKKASNFPPPDLTISDVAKILKRSRDSIVTLINSGNLKAYNAAPRGRLKQYRVTEVWLDEFREKNKKRASLRRRKKTVARDYIKFV